jgi:hypothetical protein
LELATMSQVKDGRRWRVRLFVVTLGVLTFVTAVYFLRGAGLLEFLVVPGALGLAIAAPVLLVALAIDASWFLLRRTRPLGHTR